jgi:hypothetical protein
VEMILGDTKVRNIKRIVNHLIINVKIAEREFIYLVILMSMIILVKI